MSDALARIFLPLVQAVVPELVEFALPGWGGPQKFLFVSIRKSHAYQARRVARRDLGVGAAGDGENARDRRCRRECS